MQRTAGGSHRPSNRGRPSSRPCHRPDPDVGDGADTPDDCPAPEWTEDDVVQLHWRLLLEVRRLADPAAPLEDKLDTLRWVFIEPEKDRLPFSFANCVRVVGCSPLSPIAYCGRVDPDDIRDQVRHGLKRWLQATLATYPAWVREAVATSPAWVEAQLARNPQWINEQVQRRRAEGDLFA